MPRNRRYADLKDGVQYCKGFRLHSMRARVCRLEGAEIYMTSIEAEPVLFSLIQFVELLTRNQRSNLNANP